MDSGVTTRASSLTDVSFSSLPQKWLENLQETEIPPEVLSGDEGQPQDTSIEDHKKASYTATVLNIVNTTIGGGTLGLPFVVRQLGLVLGVAMLIFGGLLMYLCSFLLQRTKNLSGRSNYVTIAKHCFNNKGSKLLSTLLIVNNLGGCIICLTIFATVAKNILSIFDPTCNASDSASVPFFCSTITLVVLGGLLGLPFCFVKTFGNMAFISILNIISITIFTAITIGYCIYSIVSGTNASDFSVLPDSSSPISSLGSIVEVIFAYNFLYNQFSMYKSMRNSSDAKIGSAVRSGLGIVMLVYIAVGVSGYLIFGSQTNNLLKNFTESQLGTLLFFCLNFSFLISSLSSYPASYFSPRNIIYKAVVEWFRNRRPVTEFLEQDEETMLMNSEMPVNRRHEKKVYIGVVLVINLLVIVLAIIVPGLNELIGILGSISADSLVFLFPAAFYLRLASKQGKYRKLAICLFVIGVLMGVSGLTSSLIQIIRG